MNNVYKPHTFSAFSLSSVKSSPTMVLATSQFVYHPPMGGTDRDSLSAMRYIDFAEHGAGLPGFSLIQALIHSALDKHASWAFISCFPPDIWEPSEGVEGRLSGAEMAAPLRPSDAPRKEDDRGAKTTLSVYSFKKRNNSDKLIEPNFPETLT